MRLLQRCRLAGAPITQGSEKNASPHTSPLIQIHTAVVSGLLFRFKRTTSVVEHHPSFVFPCSCDLPTHDLDVTPWGMRATSAVDGGGMFVLQCPTSCAAEILTAVCGVTTNLK